MKQLRIDFPDYSAREQERDSMRSCFKQVYLMKVDCKWAHFTIIDGKDDYDFYEGDLTQTYYEVKSKLPQHVVKVIQNKGLEDYLRDRLPKKIEKKQQNKIMELPIIFEKGR